MKELKIAFVIIGAIIGAGFASGKEIYEYFAKHGDISLFFLLPLFICFFLFIKIYLRLGRSYKNIKIQEINNAIAKPIKIFEKSFSYLNIFMLITFLILSSAMFSGLIALTETYFPDMNKVFCYIIVITISIIMTNLSFKTLSTFSYIIVPLIIVSIAICAFFSFKNAEMSLNFDFSSTLTFPMLTLAYASQNTFLSSFAIMQLGADLTEKEQNRVSLYVSLFLCFLLALGIMCFIINPSLGEYDMPFAEMSKSVSPYFSIIFGLIILCAIITTYITTLSSLKEYFRGDKKYNKSWLMLLLIVLLSLFEFGTIIEYLYPLIGIFGVIYCYKSMKYQNLSFKSFFKSANNGIHSASKDAKDNRTS